MDTDSRNSEVSEFHRRHLSNSDRLQRIYELTAIKNCKHGEMARIFFIIGIVVAILGFTGIAAEAAMIAKSVFFLFLFILDLNIGLAQRPQAQHYFAL